MLIDAFRSRFIFETLPGGFFIRLPFIGQGVYHCDPGFRVWDSWGTLRATGEV